MRVLLVSHTCQSRTEGHPRAEHLASMPGVDLRVLVPDRWRHYGRWRSPDLPDKGAFSCQVGRVAWPWAGPAQFYLHWYPQLPSILREFKPDIIDLWEEPWGLVSVQACLLRDRLLPSAKILTETEQNINRVLPAPFEQFRRYTIHSADYAVARSREALDVLTAKVYTGPGEVIPNAVDADLFRPLDRRECRQKLGIADSTFLIGYIGRLVPEKGLADIVDALALCPANVQCIVVGSGPAEAELIAQAERLNVASRLQILPSRPQAELTTVFNALDVFVLASRTTPTWKEQFGRVIIEAHACGTPVIGTRSGAIPDVIGAGGVTVPESDPKAIADAIMSMRGNPSATRAMGETGRREVEQTYTWQVVAKRYATIFSEMLKA